MAALLDIRAREISALRGRARELGETLAVVERNARENDRILLAMHRLAVLLIAKPVDWRAQAAALLQKQFALSFCEVVVFGGAEGAEAALRRAAMRLPLGGRAGDAPLVGGGGGVAEGGLRRFFYVPLRKGGETVGVVAMASRRADAFPADAARDFSRRLAELLAAAVE